MPGHRPLGELGKIRVVAYIREKPANEHGKATYKKTELVAGRTAARSWFRPTDAEQTFAVRPDGFTADARVTSPWTGRESRLEASGPTATEATLRLKSKVADLVGQPDDGQYNRDTRLSTMYADWRTVAIEDGTLSTGALATYASSWSANVSDALGDLRAAQLTTTKLDQYLRAIWRIHPGAARTARALLVNVLKFGAQRGAPTRDVMAGVGSMKTTKSQGKPAPQALDADQVQGLRDAVGAWQAHYPGNGPHRPQYVVDILDVMVATGCRPGEALALRWEDIDLVTGAVTIAGTLIDVTGSPLHRQEYRKHRGGDAPLTVLVPDWCLAVLMRRFAEMMPGVVAVFPNREGNWLSLKNVGTRWRAALAGSEFEGVARKMLRSTVGTAVARDAGSAAAAADQLGNTEAVAAAYYVAPAKVAPDRRSTLEQFAPRQMSGDVSEGS